MIEESMDNSANLNHIPVSVACILGDRTGTMDGLGKSRAQVFLFDDYVLKIRPANAWDTADVQILQWLSGKAPVPQVVAHEIWNGQDWLLMTRLQGKELCKPDVMNHSVGRRGRGKPAHYQTNPKCIIAFLIP